jgi:MipA family protein
MITTAITINEILIMKKESLSWENISRITLLMACVTTSFQTFAYTSIGAGVGFGKSEYKDYDNDLQPFPMINYSDDHFYFHGLSGGMYLTHDKTSAFTLGLSYFPKEFDTSDTSDSRLKRLDNRHSTAFVDIGYSYNSNIGTFSAIASADFLGTSAGGKKVKFDYKKAIRVLPRVTITPGVGITWFNQSFNQYYYGVSASESSRSLLDEYQPGSSSATNASLGINIALTKNIGLFATTQYTLLADEITDSPMVDNDHQWSSFIGISVGL